jgi:hypothetical protein
LLEDLQGSYVVEGNDRYIDVEMQVAFSNGDGKAKTRGFLEKTVGQWLRDNAVRDGVPYVIEIESISMNQTLLETVTMTDSGNKTQRPAGAGRKPNGRTPGRNTGNTNRGNAGGGMGTPGMGAPGGGGQQPGRRKHNTNEKIDPGAGPQGGSGIGSQSGEYVGSPPGGSGFGGNGFGNSNGTDSWRNNNRKGDDEAQSLDLAAEAPIPGEPSLYSVGDVFYIGRVTFRIKFVDPNAGTPNG